MNFLRSLFRFFIFSNLFISCCAVIMAWQTCYVLGLQVDTVTLLFIFCATMTSYSFHWMLTTEWLESTPRSAWQKRYAWIHTVLLVVAAIATAWLGLMLIEHWPYLLLIAFITFLYSAPKIPHPLFRSLRKIALGKTLFLSIVWAVVTTMIPVITSGSKWTPGVLFYLLNRFFLVYAICILFDVRDREYDKAHGIRSLITWLKPLHVRYLFYLSLFLFGITALILLAFGQPLWLFGILLVPGVITGLLYDRATSEKSDHLFYFVLDGLMALSALLMWVIDRVSI